MVYMIIVQQNFNMMHVIYWSTLFISLKPAMLIISGLAFVNLFGNGILQVPDIGTFKNMLVLTMSTHFVHCVLHSAGMLKNV